MSMFIIQHDKAVKLARIQLFLRQAHMIVQWKEEFKRRSRVKCPCPGCWLEFPSIYGVKYHYQRCQGVSHLPLRLVNYLGYILNK